MSERSPWTSLSGVLEKVHETEKDARARGITEGIADRRRRARFRFSDECAAGTEPAAGIPAKPHRDARQLSADFFRFGRVNWMWSTVTYQETTIFIEVYAPTGVTEAAAKMPKRLRRGRPSHRSALEAEAERRWSSGQQNKTISRANRGRELRDWLFENHGAMMEPESIVNALKPVWDRLEGSPVTNAQKIVTG
jgi:hypothetical protein